MNREIKKEFNEKFQSIPEKYRALMTSFFLSKLDAYKAELVEQIEGEKYQEKLKRSVKNVFVLTRMEDDNKILSHIINLIKEGK